MQRAKKGFTVVEILLVTAILLVITSFALPAVMREIRTAEDIAALTTLQNLQSVHRIARGLLLTEGAEVPLRAGQMVHIPQRQGEVKNAYAQYIADRITEAYGGGSLVYEIEESRTSDRTRVTFCYWPKPQEKPMRCYTLCDGTLRRIQRAAPGTKTADASSAPL
ncbi:MAG: type II secretion system protein [Ruthenibacterium sp.]